MSLSTLNGGLWGDFIGDHIIWNMQTMFEIEVTTT
jgi:hypothetical protein